MGFDRCIWVLQEEVARLRTAAGAASEEALEQAAATIQGLQVGRGAAHQGGGVAALAGLEQLQAQGTLEAAG